MVIVCPANFTFDKHERPILITVADDAQRQAEAFAGFPTCLELPAVLPSKFDGCAWMTFPVLQAHREAVPSHAVARTISLSKQIAFVVSIP